MAGNIEKLEILVWCRNLVAFLYSGFSEGQNLEHALWKAGVTGPSFRPCWVFHI